MFRLMILSIAALAFSQLSAQSQDMLGDPAFSGLLAGKVYKLENAKASKIAPILEGALRNANPEAPTSCNAQEDGNAIILALPHSSLPLADALVKVLDTPLEPAAKDSAPGPGFKSHKPKYMPPTGLAKMLASLPEGADAPREVLFDLKSGTVHWRGPADFLEAADRLIASDDTPQTQTRMLFKAYRFDPKGIRNLCKILSSDTAADGVSRSILTAMKSHLGVDCAGSSECAVAQGVKFSAAQLNAGQAGKYKITVAYPVMESKREGGISVYTDFVFDCGGETRTARWTLKSGVELPLAAFSLTGNGIRTVSFHDMDALGQILRKTDPSSITGELIVITGSVRPAEQGIFEEGRDVRSPERI